MTTEFKTRIPVEDEVSRGFSRTACPIGTALTQRYEKNYALVSRRYADGIGCA